MRPQRFLRALSITLGIAVAAFAQSAIGAEKGILIIKIEFGILNSQGSDLSHLSVLDRFDLMNLTTKQEYSIPRPLHVAAEEVDEGIYCLYSFKMAGTSLDLPYCGEPYFKVAAGHINNAGLWRYGVSFERNQQRLIFGARNLESVLNEAKKYHGEVLRKYGMHLDN